MGARGVICAALVVCAACNALTGVGDLAVASDGVVDASSSSSSTTSSSGSTTASSSSSSTSSSGDVVDSGATDADDDDDEVVDSGDAGGSPTDLPIVFVQSSTTKPTSTVTTLTLAKPVNAHDAIILCLNFPAQDNPPTVSVTDSLNSTYAIVAGPITGNGANHYVIAAYDVAAASSATVTLTLSAAPSGGSDLMGLEYSGLALADAFDVSQAASGTGTAMNSSNITTTFPHELLIGYGEGPSISAGQGWTGRASQSGNLVEERLVGSAGAYAAIATNSNGGWEMILATFKGRLSGPSLSP